MKFLDQITLPVLLLDEAGLIIHANPAFCSWAGMGRRRWLQLNMQQLGASKLYELVQKVIETNQSERIEQLVFHPLPEVELLARASILPLRDADDAKVLIEFQVREEGDKGTTRWPEALSATLKGLAHEIRNPLAGLRGAAQLLARRIEDADARRYIEIIEAETSRLNNLVERLLNPKPALPMVTLNVHEILERVRLLAEADAAWTCRVLRDYDPSLPMILGSDERLMQAIWNLVRNALQANASEVRLRTRIEHAAILGDQPALSALRIDIIDNGCGVTDEITPHIFLPLVSGRADGVGLGLAITQEIVREHGGVIDFKSYPGHTVFTVLLPIPLVS